MQLAALTGVVCKHLAAIFTKHGAVALEPPLLSPLRDINEQDQRLVTLLDRQGELVTLPGNALVPFARMAARSGIARIKRFHIGNIYRPVAMDHPQRLKAAAFDIITPDVTTHGIAAAAAEAILVASECLDVFPKLSSTDYTVFVSHARCPCFWTIGTLA